MPTPSLTSDPGGGIVKGSAAFGSETPQHAHSQTHPQAWPSISASLLSSLTFEFPGDFSYIRQAQPFFERMLVIFHTAFLGAW